VCFVVLCCEVKVSGTYVDVQKNLIVLVAKKWHFSNQKKVGEMAAVMYSVLVCHDHS
jgi:hypothetical protein